MAVKPVPDGYHTVTPYLTLDDAAAIDYYKQAFGAKERVRMDTPDGAVGLGGSHVSPRLAEKQSIIGAPFAMVQTRLRNVGLHDSAPRPHGKAWARSAPWWRLTSRRVLVPLSVVLLSTSSSCRPYMQKPSTNLRLISRGLSFSSLPIVGRASRRHRWRFAFCDLVSNGPRSVILCAQASPL